MSANIRLNGSPTPLTVTAGTPVTLSNFDNTGVAGWAWELLDKPESSASGIAAPNSATTTSTPDLSGGSYLIRLTTYKDVGRTIIDDVDQAIILVNFTLAPVDPLPAAGETREADPNLGWKARLNRFLKFVHDATTVLVGPLGQSLLGTGASAAFGIPKTSTTVTSTTGNYFAVETDRLIVMTGVAAVKTTMNGTAPPAGFSRVVRIVSAGPTSIEVRDPGGTPIYVIPGFTGAYVDLATSNGTVWTVMNPSLANASLFGSTDSPGDLGVRGASKWGRLAAGAEGFSLLVSGGTPVYDIPLPYMQIVTGTGTISASARLVLYTGGADATLTMPSTAPPSPFARTVQIINTTSHVVTVKDPAAAVIGYLDGSVVSSSMFGTPDGTTWGLFNGFTPLPYDTYSDVGLFILAASTSVGDVVRVDNLTNGYPRITRQLANATSVLTNPLYLVMKTQDGSAAAVNVLAFAMKRGLITGYNVGGSPSAGAAVYVTDAGLLSTAAGTYKRQVGIVLSGASTSWNVWFDGTGDYGNVMPVVFGSDARGDLAVRGVNNYDRLGIGASGRVLASDGTDPSWIDPSTLLAGPFIKPPNTFASADFALTALTSPTLIGQTTTAAVNLTGANSLTKDISFICVKTNTGTNKITLKCPTSWTINDGTVSTDLDLPGSTAAVKGVWWIHTDIANLKMYVHPAVTNGALWWFG